MAVKKKKAVSIDPTDVKQELLKKYPPKVARKRAKQIMINEGQGRTPPEISANVRTIPGIITMRGCTYAGCKGVILGPTRDIVNITHGPIGCGFYSWLTRRNQTDATGDEKENYMTYSFSTDMNENDIVFGGEKKLAQAIQEAYDAFHPKAIAVFSTCPVGLIGDDVHSVAREMKKKLNEQNPDNPVNVFAFSCEGYKGVSQSAGHHIANNQIFTHVVGEQDKGVEGEYRINLLGEYNIGGDAFVIEDIMERCGITLVSTFSGNSTYEQFARAHTADLNAIMCHRSINYVAEMMEEKYGIPWIKVNFIGAEATAKSLRKIAEYFGDKKLKDRVEEVIAEEMAAVEKARDEVRPRTEGKTAMLFVGGSRAHHYQELFAEIGMKTQAAGYEFAHRDDYEGRRVIPDIKIDADSRNIEELEVCPDEHRFQPRKSPEEMAELEKSGEFFREYEGMMADMEKDTLAVDDLNQHEAERLVEIYKPDLFCAGIKEKFSIQKMGVPMKQLHSYDSGGPYAGFEGAVNFYHEIDRLVNSKVWSFMKAPWEENPELTGSYVWE
ncbi:nitrogenase molybdenum-iron protein alpha chain [Desulfohalovibrio reitneri]|uniref:nitrogenase molybdenum-iron protein alpha chain n=1 Tax=Desulfohalovibrio reitneri TaxID=1307759 RepID=UPI0004A71338|nr:nitrogenase molybdenum-iron protein alpha chain [Desulfohalovibrio reitneri]